MTQSLSLGNATRRAEMTFAPVSAKCATHAVGVELLLMEIGANTAVAAARTAIATRTVRSGIGKMATGRNARGWRSICAIFFSRLGLEGLIRFRRWSEKFERRGAHECLFE